MVRLVSDRAELAPRTALLNERARELAHRGVIARAAAFVSAPAPERTSSAWRRIATSSSPSSSRRDPPGQKDPDPDLALVLWGAPCDVAFMVARVGPPDGPVVVPFGGVDHDWAAIELGAWVAKARGRSSSARRRRGDCGCRKARCEPIALPCLARSAESRGDLRRAAAGRRGGRGDALGEQGGGGPGRRPFGALATGGARAGATGVGQGRRTPRTLRPVRASSWRPRSERDPHQVHLVGWTDRAIGGFSLL